MTLAHGGSIPHSPTTIRVTMKRKPPAEQTFSAVPETDALSTYDIERHVLGTILTDESAFHLVRGMLPGGHVFSSPVLASLYHYICELDSKGLSIDVPLLIQLVSDNGKLEALGGKQFIAGLIENTVYPEYLESYCATILQKWQLRAAGSRVESFESEVRQPGVVPAELLSQLVSDLSRIAQGGDRKKAQQVGEFVDLTIEDLQRRKAIHDAGGFPGINTGVYAVDKLTGGAERGEFWIIAARPHVGKTSLSLQMCHSMAKNYGVPVHMKLLEATAQQAMMVLISRETGIPAAWMRHGNLSSEQFAVVARAANKIRELPLYLDYASTAKTSDIVREITRLHSEHGIEAFFIDYLGLMLHDKGSKDENTATSIGNTTRTLKNLAMELNVWIVANAQLNRDAANQELPKLENLRDSGAIEQDADCVLFIHRLVFDKDKQKAGLTPTEQEKESQAKIICAKRRFGDTGIMDTVFDKRTATFKTIDTVHEQQYVNRQQPKQVVNRQEPQEKDGQEYF